LTTLITVSPQQNATNFDQLSMSAVVNFMSSGNAWVGRGIGMHITLDVTVRREPLASHQLQQLAESIINAPVSGIQIRGGFISYTASGLEAAQPSALSASEPLVRPKQQAAY